MVRTHTMKWKQREAQELKKLMDESKVIAVAELSRFPSDLFGEIRKKLAGKAKIRVTKTRIALKALNESKFKDCGLENFLKGSIALVFTGMDPFELYLLLKKSKGKAPAKAGMIAESDILVPAGDTGLPPGPDLADLKNAGLKVQLKGASIKIAEDCVVVKKGEKVNEAVAKALAKLDIKPVEIGLKITAAVEGKQLFEASVLDISVDETIEKIMKAFSDSLNLSVSIVFPNKANIAILLAKSFREAKGVALQAEYLCKETMPELLGKAKRQAEALGGLVKFEEAPKEETGKEEKKEEKPEEEKQAGEKPKEEKPVSEEQVEEKLAEEKKEEKQAGKEGKEEKPSKETPKEEKKEEPAQKGSAEKKE